MRGFRLFGGMALLAAVVLLGAACGGGSQAGPANPATRVASPGGTESSAEAPAPSGGRIAIGGEMANDHGTKDVSGVSEISLELDDFYFEPTILQGAPGQKITIELENEGQQLHNFSLPDQNVDQDVQPDGKAAVTVTLPSSGSAVFFCKFHRSLGMLGQLSV